MGQQSLALWRLMKPWCTYGTISSSFLEQIGQKNGLPDLTVPRAMQPVPPFTVCWQMIALQLVQ